MNGSIDKLTGALINAVKACDDPAVFRFRVISIHPADGCNLQPSVFLDLRDHGPKRVHMCLQENTVFYVAAFQIHQHTALDGFLRMVSQPFILCHQVIGSLLGVSGGTVNCQQIFHLLQNIIQIFVHNDIPFLFLSHFHPFYVLSAGPYIQTVYQADW